jgi:hypothetical protein
LFLGEPVCLAVPTRSIEVPAISGRDHTEQFFSAFLEEYRPVGPTELAIVRDVRVRLLLLTDGMRPPGQLNASPFVVCRNWFYLAKHREVTHTVTP